MSGEKSKPAGLTVDNGDVLPPDPVIEAYKKDIDRTLLRQNLKLTIEQRLDQLMELQRFVEEMQRAGRAARHD